jgi:hypothetical protein
VKSEGESVLYLRRCEDAAYIAGRGKSDVAELHVTIF